VRKGVRRQSSIGPSCSVVRSELSAASSRWPPRRQTIIPRRPESFSIRLRVPIAFLARRNSVVTVIGTASLRRGGRSWVVLLEGVVPAAGDSSERLSIHVVDLKRIVATWSWPVGVYRPGGLAAGRRPCRLSWQCVATDERSRSARCQRPHRVSRWRPLESSEQLGNPCAGVAARCGARSCWPRSWLAAFERHAIAPVQLARAGSPPRPEGGAGVEGAPGVRCFTRGRGRGRRDSRKPSGSPTSTTARGLK